MALAAPLTALMLVRFALGAAFAISPVF